VSRGSPCAGGESVEGLSVARSGDSRIGWFFKHGGLAFVRESISEVLVGPTRVSVLHPWCGHRSDPLRGRNPLPPTHIGKATW
jgi:hypothetical protein